MPALQNERHEAFAQARARGENQTQAYALAGYAPSGGAGSKMDRRDYIVKRVAELVELAEKVRETSLEETILKLLALANAAEKMESAAGVKEARVTRLEAWRLRGLLDAQNQSAVAPPWPRELTEAEWEAKYGPDAPGGR